MPATLPTRTTRTDRAVHALRVRVPSLLLDRPRGDGARTVEVLTSDDARLLTRYRAPHSALGAALAHPSEPCADEAPAPLPQRRVAPRPVICRRGTDHPGRASRAGSDSHHHTMTRSHRRDGEDSHDDDRLHARARRHGRVWSELSRLPRSSIGTPG